MRVIVTGGGTGGHIYPALSIINKIREKEPKSEFLYIGTHNRMEKDIVPSHGIPYKSLEIIGFNRKKIHRNILTLKLFLKAIKVAKRMIREFKPDIVIGVGGYVTAPVIYAAHKLGIKTIIHEQNSVLGLSNRFLLKYVDCLATSFKETIHAPKSKKIHYTGNPVSEDLMTMKPIDKTSLGLKENKKLILIVMGSLGSKRMNDKMKSMLTLFFNRPEEVLFITGNSYYEEFKNCHVSSNIKIIPFLEHMSSLFQSVDVLISRAGATTMSEIIAAQVPSILIPSPHVTDNHQYENAKALVDKQAALMIEEDKLEGDILIREVDKLLRDKNLYQSMKNNLKQLHVSSSATTIYEIIKTMTRGE